MKDQQQVIRDALERFRGEPEAIRMRVLGQLYRKAAAMDLQIARLYEAWARSENSVPQSELERK